MKGTVIRGHGAPGESECRSQKMAPLINHVAPRRIGPHLAAGGSCAIHEHEDAPGL